MVLRIVILLVALTTVAQADGPRLASPSAIAIDATIGDVLFVRRADEVRPILSGITASRSGVSDGAATGGSATVVGSVTPALAFATSDGGAVARW